MIQKIYAKGMPKAVSVGVVRFSRCPYALTSFYDMSGTLVRGYTADHDYRYSCELGYEPHEPQCFTFPFERAGAREKLAS